MTTNQKIFVGVVLLGTWAGFAAFNLTPVQPLIDYIKFAAGALGLVHVALKNPKE